MSQGAILRSIKAIPLVEYCSYLKSATQAELNGKAYCHSESAICQIPSFAAIQDPLHHRDSGRVVHRNILIVRSYGAYS
jgi:hypothetical protein